MPLIVQKFGGTSVGSIDRILMVTERIVEAKNKGNDVVVVVSAMGQSTNSLVDMAERLSPNPAGREMDMLLATGEQVSISLLAMALISKGYPAVSLTGWQAGIMTDTVHNRARIVHIHSDKIVNLVRKGTIVIVAGFQGITEDGEVTTLGRGVRIQLQLRWLPALRLTYVKFIQMFPESFLPIHVLCLQPRN